MAATAEDAGFTRLPVMDHFWQITGVGPPEHEMVEAYTVLGFLAAHTERVQLHTLVTGVVYREPAVLAKAVTTLDVLSGGRAGLGIGAAWNEEESLGLGLPFPPTAERFERLEETLQICLQMWRGREDPFDGTHYRLGRTLSSPANLSSPRAADHDRRHRRAEDPAPRGPLRGCLQPLRRARRRPQARRAPRPLRTGRPATTTGSRRPSR